jgi:hypothetical protein
MGKVGGPHSEQWRACNVSSLVSCLRGTQPTRIPITTLHAAVPHTKGSNDASTASSSWAKSPVRPGCSAKDGSQAPQTRSSRSSSVSTPMRTCRDCPPQPNLVSQSHPPSCHSCSGLCLAVQWLGQVVEHTNMSMLQYMAALRLRRQQSSSLWPVTSVHLSHRTFHGHCPGRPPTSPGPP